MNEAPEYVTTINASFSLLELKKPLVYNHYIKLYKAVGDAYGWTDRLNLSENELNTLINKDETHLFLLLAEGRELGFTELVVEKDFVEIQYFGLFTSEIGKGYGPPLLQLSIEKAWSYAKNKVQLNTCDLDHPQALKLYKMMGFDEVKRKTVS